MARLTKSTEKTDERLALALGRRLSLQPGAYQGLVATADRPSLLLHRLPKNERGRFFSEPRPWI